VEAARRRFEVEHAGCQSCAERIRGALSPLATVDEITIDEGADTATVSISASEAIERVAVDEALARASIGSGHQYRVKSGSWNETF
jgi:hypothetical protein